MMLGVVAFAVGIELAVEHPVDTLPLAGRAALAAGFGLFVGGTAVALWRASGRLLVARLALTGGVVIAMFTLPGISSMLALGIMFVALVVLGVIEAPSARRAN